LKLIEMKENNREFTMKNILEIKNVSLQLGDKNILDDVTLDIWRGHVHAVVGPNGAGKSTLASVIMGLEGFRDIEGDILFEGDSITGLSIDERARLGITLAWQEPARYEGLKVREFIAASAQNKDEDFIADALEKAGVSPVNYLDRALDKTLSGGERKKIELASILAMRPKLVLLDEPDSGIDVASLQKIFDAITLLKEIGSTVVLITHSLAVLEKAEHAFLLCCGHFLRKGSVDAISSYYHDSCLACNHKNEPDLTGEENAEN
jgi:Fe-S cluster assembly ATP-binding protein